MRPTTITVTSFVTSEETTETYTTLWLTIENEYFVVYYHPGYEADAKEALEYAMWVRNNTMNKYPHTLDVKVEIYLYSNREEIMEKEGCPTAISHVGVSGGVLTTAKIGILRPSWEGHWGGYEQLDHPFRRVLNHEYVHIPFYYHLYSKKRGYTNPPSWFSQGLAEYISGNYLPSYEQRVREAVLQGSYTIDEPYSWGLYIVEYMYEEYGKEKIISLIKSDAPTFLDAIRKELGISPAEFEQGWKAYLADKFGG